MPDGDSAANGAHADAAVGAAGVARTFGEALSAYQSGDTNAAARLFQSVLERAPNHLHALTSLAACHFARQDYVAAEALYLRALEQAPKDATVLQGLGTAVQESGRLTDAVAIFQAALAADADNVAVLHNMANALRDLGRLDEALACYREALKRKPDHHMCGLNYSAALFYKEDWNEAWRMFEARLTVARILPPLAMHTSAGNAVAPPPWRGGPQPSSLLVIAEQGLGDTIQFVRFLPELARTGSKVTLLVDGKLIALLRTLAGAVDFVAREAASSVGALRGWVPLLSLPLALGLRPGGLAQRSPYLHAEAARVARWRGRLAGDGLKVGICWQGNPAGSVDRGRSLPLALLAPLADIPGVRLVSLQKGFGEEQVGRASFRDRIEALGPDFDAGPDAFLDTAAVMSALDLVITTDTATAHLAGALGRPLWVLLQKAPNWRWLYQGESSPFYPTARLFRQDSAGDWSTVVARMVEELRELAAARGSADDAAAVTVPVSVGELIDKITILEIKAERIADADKLANVRHELAALEGVRASLALDAGAIGTDVDALKGVNRRLWDIEDAIRECEAAGDFGSSFVALARSVYQCNDERARLKKAINVACGSRYVEEKSYKGS